MSEKYPVGSSGTLNTVASPGPGLGHGVGPSAPPRIVGSSPFEREPGRADVLARLGLRSAPHRTQMLADFAKGALQRGHTMGGWDFRVNGLMIARDSSPTGSAVTRHRQGDRRDELHRRPDGRRGEDSRASNSLQRRSE
jgi:hypothetical protein